MHRAPAPPARILAALLAVSILAACTGGGGGGGGGPTTPAAPTLTLTATPGAIGITGFADLSVRVLSGAGAAQPGAVVELQTTLGNLVATSVTTGADGRAATALRGDGHAGTATVTARLAGGGATAQQTVRIGQGTRITLRAEPDTIAGDGVAEIFGIVTRLDGSSTPAGVTVDLVTTLGTLSDAHPRTDGAGAIRVQLRADGRAGIAAVTATTADAVETARIDVTVAAATQLNLQATPIAIPSDGRATLIVSVRDGAGRPTAGVTVQLSTTRGRIATPTLQSDGLGQAITELLAEGAQGRARVTAQAAGATRTADVDLGQGLTLVLRAAPTAIAKDGATTITLLATSADNRPVPIGTQVIFSTTLGHLDVDHATVAETALATTILRGTGQAGNAVVTARVAGFSGQQTLTVPIR